MRDWTGTAKVLTAAAVLSLLGAAYAALDWAEAAEAREVLGAESLRLDFEAPAKETRGPWQEGHIFDRHAVGVPLGLAPDWRILATYSRTGPPPTDAQWHASSELRLLSGGRTWWSQQREIPIEDQGRMAVLHLDVERLAEEASRLAAEAGVPGQVQLRVMVHHTSTVETELGNGVATRTARLHIDPQTSAARVEVHDDSAVYQKPVVRPVPFMAGGLLGAGGAAIALALVSRSRTPVALAVGAIPVRGLVVPQGAVETTPHALARLARKGDATVFVDIEQGIMLLSGDHPVAARIDEAGRARGPPATRSRRPSGLGTRAYGAVRDPRFGALGPNIPPDVPASDYPTMHW